MEGGADGNTVGSDVVGDTDGDMVGSDVVFDTDGDTVGSGVVGAAAVSEVVSDTDGDAVRRIRNGWRHRRRRGRIRGGRRCRQ